MTTKKEMTIVGVSPEVAAKIHERVKVSVIAYIHCPNNWGAYGPSQPNDRMSFVPSDEALKLGYAEPEKLEQGCWTIASVMDGFFDRVPGMKATGEGRYLEDSTEDARRKLLVVLLATDLSTMTPSQHTACEAAIAEIRGEV